MLFGLIPARGGSKRLPGKNLLPLAGKPLIGYACEAAIQAQCLARVYVSTDSRDIADVAAQYGAEIITRPAAIALDDTPMLPVVQHALQHARSALNEPTAVVLLQPTSPLRRPNQILEAVALFHSEDADTVVSVTPVPHQFHPDKLMGWRDGRFGSYLPSAPSPGRTPVPGDAFGRNGPAILISRSTVIDQGSLYGTAIHPYLMCREDSVDIDTLADFELAEYFFTRRASRGSS